MMGRPNPNKGKGASIKFIRDHVNEPDGPCLIWPFGCDDKGYGTLGYEGKTEKAHRLMCKLAKGEPPTPRHQASHSCGNGDQACIHPKHLSWKTNSQNQLDRREHGKPLGHRYGRTGKLTPEQVAEIQAARGKITIRKLAAHYGVKRGAIDYWHKQAKKGIGYTAHLTDWKTVNRRTADRRRQLQQATSVPD